jgi:hypothetical protein
VAVTAAALALSGCGRDGARADVQASVQRFGAAFAHRDGAAACALLSQDTRAKLEQSAGKRCAKALPDLPLKVGSVVRIGVYVTNAEVDLDDGERAFLSYESGSWHLSAVGCKPHGDPAGQPSDCQLES